jgi:hypothetical protein
MPFSLGKSKSKFAITLMDGDIKPFNWARKSAQAWALKVPNFAKW